MRPTEWDCCTITRTLAELHLDVHLAKVATFDGRVIDAFYVRDSLGRKVTDADQLGRSNVPCASDSTDRLAGMTDEERGHDDDQDGDLADDDEEWEEDEDLDDEDDGAPGLGRTNEAIGPLAAVVVGFFAFYLARGFSFLPRLGIALVVMTVVTFVSVEITRRRRHR